MKGSYLGPKFKNDFIEQKLNSLKANYKKYSREEMISLTAKELSNEKTVGWFQEEWNLDLERLVEDQY